MKKEFKYKSWSVIYSLQDGARLNRLSYDGADLLSLEPDPFKAPQADYGEYELRPVYGYDDCFPNVDSCLFPDSEINLPDHGELCWLPWQVEEYTDHLTFTVKSKMLPVVFKRMMRFDEHELHWEFKVTNDSGEELPFMHVMHPLMPLSQIKGFHLPEFESVFDEIKEQTLSLKTAKEVQTYLLNQPRGTANMLILQQVQKGNMVLDFKNLSLEIDFPVKLIPSIGIWWNHLGYPDENGCHRNECAFEPIPGSSSVLTESYQTSTCLAVLPGQCLVWDIFWRLK